MSKFEKYATIFIVVCLAIVAAGFACKIAHKRGYRVGWDDALASIKPDTLWRTDTIYKDRPVPVEVKPSGQEMYPIGTVAQLKKVIDSLVSVKPDTAFVQIPIPTETKLYGDSTYTAQVSGYKPTLDWIKVYPRTAYITKPVPEYKYPSLVVSPKAGIEILPQNLFVGAGVGVDYWTGRFQISVEAGYGLDIHDKVQTPGWYAEWKVGYNLIRK